MMINKILITVVFAMATTLASSQAPISQVIKGTVRDKDSQIPLPGATVMVQGINPAMGTSTDNNGNFRLDNVPVGRQTLQISFLGYEPYIIRELLIGSGKEVVINVDLKESSVEMEAVTVKAYSNKEQPVNSMASIGVRQLSVEEANRYAGGFDDPARLASAFAGVAASLGNNGIVIRGNAPKGLLWRMEGVEISTPSHFANITSFGGGGITALSSQMLANSDFFTGAFPSEYGNALSGVFDLNLRNGNNEKTECTLQAGVIGLDASAEGPFNKGNKSSFLFNYRYSTFSLIGPFLPADAGGISYQDLCFKLNFPTKNFGVLSIWGIGALDKNPQKAEKDTNLWKYDQDKEQAINNLKMGALGVNHKIILSNKSFLHSTLSMSGNGLYHNLDHYSDDLILQPKELVEYYNWKYSLSTYLNHKFSNKHTNRTGIIIDNLNYNYNIQHADPGLPLIQIINENANTNLFQFFSQSKYEISHSIELNLGLHAQYFSLNQHYAIEPRVGAKWKFAHGHSLSIGYGNHSQLEMLQLYFVRHEKSSGYNLPNKNLDFSKARHFVLAYDWMINENLRLKIEPYYQSLYNIPVVPDSSFSLINLDKNWFINDSLVNTGKGTNTGIDFTLEHFLKQGYYYMVTASLFNSKYKGGDGIQRNTMYNKHYVINILGGKEWVIKNAHLLSINGKVCFMGGDRISPLDMQASLIKKDAVYDESQAFANKKPDVWYVDFTVNYKINKRRHSSTWSLKIINLLGTKEFAGYRYNYKTAAMDRDEEAIVVPNVSYKIEF